MLSHRWQLERRTSTMWLQRLAVEVEENTAARMTFLFSLPIISRVCVIDGAETCREGDHSYANRSIIQRLARPGVSPPRCGMLLCNWTVSTIFVPRTDDKGSFGKGTAAQPTCHISARQP